METAAYWYHASSCIYCIFFQDQPRQLPLERKSAKRGKQKIQENRECGSKGAKNVRQSKDVKEMSFEELLALHKSERDKSREVNPVLVDSKETADSGEKGRKVLEARRDSRIKSSSKRLYFPVSSQAEVKRKTKTAEDCWSIYQHYQKLTKDADVDAVKPSDNNTDSHLGFFTTREAMKNLLGRGSNVARRKC